MCARVCAYVSTLRHESVCARVWHRRARARMYACWSVLAFVHGTASASMDICLQAHRLADTTACIHASATGADATVDCSPLRSRLFRALSSAQDPPKLMTHNQNQKNLAICGRNLWRTGKDSRRDFGLALLRSTDTAAGGRVCTVGCTAWSAQSRQAEMGLSKAQEQQAVANAKNEIAAFSDMYNRCERAARVDRACTAGADVRVRAPSRMVKQCFEKCVESFHDKELTLGENTCLDR